MRNIFFLLSALLFLHLYSCTDCDDTLGSSLVESSFRNISTDTCTIKISTIYVDSVMTTGDSICQIGYYSDSVRGKIASSYLAEFKLNQITPDDDHTYVFDSITITFSHCGNYWGDTLSMQNISIHPIKSEIILPDDNTLYNTSAVDIDPVRLCRYQLAPRPQSRQEIEIRLPDSFGKKLLEDMIAEKQAFDSQEKFKAYFPGLALIPDDTGNCITGFAVNDSSMYITLYYQDIYTERTEKELVFTVNKECAYTRVEHDRLGTPFEILQGGNNNAVPSEELNNCAYMMGLAGLYNQIEIPYLHELRGSGDIISVESATLYLYPKANSYLNNQLPEELRLYVANDNNVLEDQVYEDSGTTVQTGNLTVDSIYNRDTYYSFNITSFLRENITLEGMYRKKLLLNMTDQDFCTSFKQVTFSNNKSDEREVKLDIRFKVYTNIE